ncbi:aminoacyl-tRNA hydrolase [Teredinibacter waterburyi]|jgi:peptidyl-tRNA hydrolase (EC 3.1.1.29)|uniref:aminoacyl-tRNA hydrolase n=1 Tax=Teredinibacter waterburyi TaxID=1500538 RepID=UPI00165F3422|nr:aminoacyl-tRNA hydrolase [Teredinibacter waterburyi]
MKDAIKLIVGLGNPGAEYAHTRHNAGQDFVEAIAQTYGETLQNTPKHFGFSGRVIIGGKDVRLLIPTTFMNRSGQAVASLANFYKVAPENILVAHDELDLAPGAAKLKIGGGHGGHNGLRDIIAALGNNNGFGRLRIGIGHPGNAKLVSNYVLKKAPSAEQALIDDAIRESEKAVPDLVNGDWEKAMRELHTSTA